MKNHYFLNLRITLSILTVLLAGTVYSCTPPEKEPALSIEPSVASIVFSPDGKTVTANGQEISATFSVNTNQDEWSVELSEKDSWLKFHEDNNKFTLSAEVNERFDNRGPITVTVKSGNATQVTISVTQTGSEKPEHNIYISGMAETRDYDWVPALWTNGELKILANDEDIILTGIGLSNHGPYLSAVRETDYGEQAIYWNNGSFRELPGNGFASGAIGVGIVGEDIYMGGLLIDYEEFITYPVYWKNGTMHALPVSGIPGAEYMVKGITVSGSDVYVFGTAYDYHADAVGHFPVYWKNGQINYVGTTAYEDVLVTDMAVDGSDIYILGAYDDDSGSIHGGYWKNDQYVALDSPGREAVPYAIEAHGGDVYIVGVTESSSSEMAVYWKNGTMNILDNSGAALDIAICEGHVYVLGIAYLEGEDGDMEQLCYWLDGANRVDITGMVADLWEALYFPPHIVVEVK